MSYEHSDVLRERSILFFNEGKRLFNESKYDLAIFMLEQAAQLFLKYKISTRIGAFKKTHSLKDLLNDLAKIYDINEIIDKYLLEISLLDDYIASRYLARRYSKEEVLKAIKFVDKLFKVLKDG